MLGILKGKILKNKDPNSHSVFLISLQAADAPKFSMSYMKNLSQVQCSSYALTVHGIPFSGVQMCCAYCIMSLVALECCVFKMPWLMWSSLLLESQECCLWHTGDIEPFYNFFPVS